MDSCSRAFLTGLIDYAGLFPPANLPLEITIKNFINYRSCPESWILSHLICPAAKLSEIDIIDNYFPDDDLPISFSIIGRSGNNESSFISNLKADFEEIREFCNRQRNKVLVDLFEVKCPPDILLKTDNSLILDLLTESSNILNSNDLSSIRIFYEILPINDWFEMTHSLINSIASSNKNGDLTSKAGMNGFKLRCGGIEKSQFLSAEQMGFAIQTCRKFGVPMKCTAGLHHPIRKYSDEVNTTMHGFINVFGAGILAVVHHLSQEEVEDIICEEDPKNFRLNEETFMWGKLSANYTEIQNARNTSVISFGSCSFEEPLEDLRTLGII